MRASDLIDFLQCAIDKHGDLDVHTVVEDASEVGVSPTTVSDILHWRGYFLLWPFPTDSLNPFAPLTSVRTGEEVEQAELAETETPKLRR